MRNWMRSIDFWDFRKNGSGLRPHKSDWERFCRIEGRWPHAWIYLSQEKVPWNHRNNLGKGVHPPPKGDPFLQFVAIDLKNFFLWQVNSLRSSVHEAVEVLYIGNNAVERLHSRGKNTVCSSQFLNLWTNRPTCCIVLNLSIFQFIIFSSTCQVANFS
jgi:hypothetical protein